MLLFGFSFIAAGISLSPFMITGVEAIKVGRVISGYNPINGPAYFAVIAWTLYLIVRLIVRITLARKLAFGKLKSQLNVIVIGAIAAVLISLLTNLVIPNITNNTSTTEFAPFASIIFMGSLALAIVQHGLFDIRLIIARTLGYIFSLVTLGAAFVVVAYLLTGTIWAQANLSSLRWIYAVLAVVLAIGFPPLKKFFDKVTNKVFYRDAYDVQAFLDNFNKIIVSTFELNKLLNNILELVGSNLKPTYCLFGLKEDDYTPRKIVGTMNSPDFKEEDISYVRSMTPKMHQKIIVADMLEPEYSLFQKKLQQIDVSVIARMTTSVETEGIGYLVLGPRKSGNAYSSQDVRALEIIANELVVAIQNALHTEEIESFNVTLQEKVKEATRRLRKSNEKLRELDEAKDDFVSMASHQLRTPLTSVKGNISLVLDGDAGQISDLQRQLLQQAFASSQRMVFLIADLLNVSRLKTGKFVIDRAPVDLAAVIEEEVGQLMDTAGSRNLTLAYNKPEHITSLMLDDNKTRQVIMNFVDNAIYYTPSGGKIDVQLTETPYAVECRVVDNGIGVPKSEEHHLFTKFYRAANARKARPDGTGLGLFMAKKVIVSEGGALIFKSQEGKGSTFGFSFPKSSLSVENFPKNKVPPKKNEKVPA